MGRKALRHQTKTIHTTAFMKNKKNKLCHREQPSLPCYLADTKRAAAHRRPGPERGVAAYRRTPEREQIILVGWPSDIGGRQHDNAALSVRYVGIKSQALTQLFL